MLYAATTSLHASSTTYVHACTYGYQRTSLRHAIKSRVLGTRLRHLKARV
jgi:hypothetical protein